MSEATDDRNRIIAILFTQGETLAEIGARYGISRERVRQILKKRGFSAVDGGTRIRVRNRSLGLDRFAPIIPGPEEPLRQDALAALDNPQWHWVYIIGPKRKKPPVKIGHTGDIADRLRNLQNSCPWKLMVLREFLVPSEQLGVDLERASHHLLRDSRMHGEWFAVNADHGALGIIAAARAHGIALYDRADIDAFARRNGQKTTLSAA